MVGSAIHAKLAATAGVTAIVPAANIYAADSSPDNVFPLIAYKLDDQTTPLLGGVQPKSKTWSLSVACVSKDPRQIEALKAAIKSALDGKRLETWGETRVQLCMFEDESFDTYAQEDAQHRFYAVEQNYKLMTY